MIEVVDAKYYSRMKLESVDLSIFASRILRLHLVDFSLERVTKLGHCCLTPSQCFTLLLQLFRRFVQLMSQAARLLPKIVE
jgi:hypothetical protein